MERFQQHGPLQCLIHQTASHLDADDHLVSPQNHDSWTALLEAAKVRNHAPLLDISKHLQGNEVPQIFYHRKRRSLVAVPLQERGHLDNHHQALEFMILSAFSVRRISV